MSEARSQRWNPLAGHPPGLAVLFFSEMWERFSFYGMRALLVLYMIEHLLLPPESGRVAGYGALHSWLEGIFGPLSTQAVASQIYGIYSSALFITPMFGGLLADRWLGERRTVVVGGVLMAIGHFLMAFETWFLLALACIVAGNGCFKPNISSQVGRLYAAGDSRRDRAFSIFYVGINLGALLAPMVCGTVGEVYGWHWGFLIAGIGMLVGLAIFLLGGRYLPPEVQPREARVSRAGTPKARLRPGDLQAMVALCAVTFMLTFFWAGYEQQGNAVVLWVRDFTDRSFFGLYELKITWFQSLDSFFIFTLTPLILMLWSWQASRGREPRILSKLAIGCCLGGIAYLVLTIAALTTGEHGQASWLWTLGYFAVLTTGELFIAPVALSLYSRAAPAAFASTMMGLWFLSGALGNYLTGFFGSFWERLSKPVFWAGMSAFAFGAGLAILLASPLLNRIFARSEAMNADQAAAR